jgi:hypothetical protein
MTGPGGERITAKAYSAASAVNAAQGPLDWGDKCFLCSNSINIDTPPVDPREFYVGKSGNMMLCHSRCIAEMNEAGGTPKDFHQARAARGQPAITPQAPPEEIKPPVSEQGAAWLHFEKLADYNAYVKVKAISSEVKITVGQQLLQAGE